MAVNGDKIRTEQPQFMAEAKITAVEAAALPQVKT
jgi:hypothetical protein